MSQSTGTLPNGTVLGSLSEILDTFGSPAEAIAELNATGVILNQQKETLLQNQQVLQQALEQTQQQAQTLYEENVKLLKVLQILKNPSMLSHYYRCLEFDTAEISPIREFRTAYPEATFEQFNEWSINQNQQQTQAQQPQQPQMQLPLLGRGEGIGQGMTKPLTWRELDQLHIGKAVFG